MVVEIDKKMNTKYRSIAKEIIDELYYNDRFAKIILLMEKKENHIRINTEDIGGNDRYLDTVFKIKSSGDYDNVGRVFDDEYDVIIENEHYKCRLTKDWQLHETAGKNSLKSLIAIVLKYYKAKLKLYVKGDNTSFHVFETYNKIFYGVPGVGKSYRIKEASDQFEQEKTVFHPEYTNADFVGQLLPVRKENDNGNNSSISYEFVPGPFTRILVKALKNQNDSEKKYMLVIDEINRGNAAAIFGEIFQLLDRDASGQSEFGISNKEVYDYLVKEAGVDKSFLPDEKIYIPSNLYIWATMNTSDQNVYTLDTAFQRRWQMEMLTIDFDKDDKTKTQGDIKIQKSKSELTWREFVTAINEEISNRNEGMISVEDKRIGPWFAKRNEIEDISLFTQKVIKYLWDDAFKMSRPDVFKNIKTLDEIVNKIEQGCYIEDIFEENMFLKVLNNRKDNQKEEKEDNDNQVNENEE